VDDNKHFITLNCWNCDHPLCRLKAAVFENSKNGCVRQVDEDLFIEYYHQLKEVWPFILKSQDHKLISAEYKKTMQVLNKVYSSPCTKKYGRGFKVMIGV
jgi:hypothetical protein